MKHHYTLILFFLLIYLPAFAQVTFIIPDKKVVKDNLVGAEIHIKTRDTISGMQFTLEWNPAILQFNSIDSSKLPEAAYDVFGTNNVVDGNMRFLWITVAANGVSFSDSALVFKVFFKAIGAKGKSDLVKFTNSLVKIKALDPRIQNLPVITRDGMMMIEGSTGIKNAFDTEGGIKLYQNLPNPVANQTYIPFEIPEAGEVKLQISDATGRIVFEKKDNYTAGKHEIPLNTEGVLIKGFYIYSIQTKYGMVSKTLIKN